VAVKLLTKTKGEVKMVTDEQIQKHIEENCRHKDGQPLMDEQAFYEGAKWMREKVGQLDPLVMPLLIKDEIAQKLIDRLNLYEKQYASDYGFINKQKIAHKVKELKKCIQMVQSA